MENTGIVEYWNDGILGIKNGKAYQSLTSF